MKLEGVMMTNIKQLKQFLVQAKNNLLLELHVPDFEKVKNFYKKLGFKIVWERKPEGLKGYLVMELENNILCFWGGNNNVYEESYFKTFPKNTPRGYGIEIILTLSDLESYYKKVKQKVSIFEELQMRSWKLKDFLVIDPFGFYLKFTETHNILNSKYPAL